MTNTTWITCPVCSGKTRTKVRKDTIIKHFPLFCPKCKQEKLVNIKQLEVTIIKEPDALTQSH